ncbi:NAD(P)H-hydrate epimerase [Altererythrobacter sp. MTPC7]|uniref:NAD(P)H-hydrate epimerase n=1 Tax=Altererythrobacter sp. MTPC7 TaxID=3056567 RepID=UPI0036F2FD5B
MAAPDRILSISAVKAAEQALFEAGLPEYELMVRAGEAAAQWVWRVSAGGRVTILCGPGNNGGDGYVIARWLHARGADVAVVAAMEPKTASAREARADYKGEVLPTDTGRAGGTFVDCLFGYGQDRPLSGDLFAVLEGLRERHDRSIAVDLPSGVSSDRAKLLNDIRPHDVTLALGAWKWAHWAMPASAVMGQRRLVDIGLSAGDNTATLITKPVLGPPPPDAHKYSRGLVAVVAGEMPGACALTARAAQHGGAGYVKVLSEKPMPPLPDNIVIDASPLAEALADERIDAVVVGPGFGRSRDAAERLGTVLNARSDAALVIDADALHLLSPEPSDFGDRPVVLTPHEGELSALEKAFGEAQEQGPAPAKLDKARNIAAKTGAIVAAKGADTIVAGTDSAMIAPPAPSWLSTAGTGDVLAGLVGSRLATGRAPMDAAAEAIWLHSEAARRAGPVFSADGLVECLPDAYASAR